jgi:hypothetical protein
VTVTIKVNGQFNSLVHKASSGIVMSTVPDVCKTPSPAGPVPIPYPVIISQSSDLLDGTTTIQVDGGNPAATKGSQLSRCSGDEAGTLGGVVSSTFMKEAKWLLYSFDVKLEGQNAARLMDKMTMNHANTVCLAGILQAPVTELEIDLVAIAKACSQAVESENDKKKAQKKKGDSCRKRGVHKHSCCKEKIDALKADGQHANVEAEWSHQDCRLDVVAFSGPPAAGNAKKIYDFKFNCTGKPKMSAKQERKYKKRFKKAQILLIGA